MQPCDTTSADAPTPSSPGMTLDHSYGHPIVSLSVGLDPEQTLNSHFEDHASIRRSKPGEPYFSQIFKALLRNTTFDAPSASTDFTFFATTPLGPTTFRSLDLALGRYVAEVLSGTTQEYATRSSIRIAITKAINREWGEEWTGRTRDISDMEQQVEAMSSEAREELLDAHEALHGATNIFGIIDATRSATQRPIQAEVDTDVEWSTALKVTIACSALALGLFGAAHYLTDHRRADLI